MHRAGVDHDGSFNDLTNIRCRSLNYELSVYKMTKSDCRMTNGLVLSYMRVTLAGRSSRIRHPRRFSAFGHSGDKDDYVSKLLVHVTQQPRSTGLLKRLCVA